MISNFTGDSILILLLWAIVKQLSWNWEVDSSMFASSKSVDINLFLYFIICRVLWWHNCPFLYFFLSLCLSVCLSVCLSFFLLCYLLLIPVFISCAHHGSGLFCTMQLAGVNQQYVAGIRVHWRVQHSITHRCLSRVGWWRWGSVLPSLSSLSSLMGWLSTRWLSVLEF